MMVRLTFPDNHAKDRNVKNLSWVLYNARYVNCIELDVDIGTPTFIAQGVCNGERFEYSTHFTSVNVMRAFARHRAFAHARLQDYT